MFNGTMSGHKLCRVRNVQGCVLTACSLIVDKAEMYQTDNDLDYIV